MASSALSWSAGGGGRAGTGEKQNTHSSTLARGQRQPWGGRPGRERARAGERQGGGGKKPRKNKGGYAGERGRERGKARGRGEARERRRTLAGAGGRVRQPDGRLSGRNFGLLESPGLETVWGGPKKSPLSSLQTHQGRRCFPITDAQPLAPASPPLPPPGDQHFTLGQRVEPAEG